MKSGPPGENHAAEESPFKVREPKVTRFNRRAVFIGAVIASSVFAFSLVATLSPKKKVQGEERAAVTAKNQPAPDLPDPIVSSPGTYNDLQLAKARGTAPQEAPGVLGKLAEPERATAETTTSAALPDEQAKAKEQAEKDAVTAMHSQVGFGDEGHPAGKAGAAGQAGVRTSRSRSGTSRRASRRTRRNESGGPEHAGRKAGLLYPA